MDKRMTRDEILARRTAQCLVARSAAELSRALSSLQQLRMNQTDKRWARIVRAAEDRALNAWYDRTLP